MGPRRRLLHTLASLAGIAFAVGFIAFGVAIGIKEVATSVTQAVDAAF